MVCRPHNCLQLTAKLVIREDLKRDTESGEIGRCDRIESTGVTAGVLVIWRFSKSGVLWYCAGCVGWCSLRRWQVIWGSGDPKFGNLESGTWDPGCGSTEEEEIQEFFMRVF